MVRHHNRCNQLNPLKFLLQLLDPLGHHLSRRARADTWVRPYGQNLNASQKGKPVLRAKCDKIDICSSIGKIGKAQIISTVDADGPQYYDIEITKIYTKSGQRNMIIEVRDKRLIEKTGGIVQGMSGSPIVQNGMLVGAVTHVFINDPLKGYAIFAQTMAEEAERISSPGYSAAL